jgi:hypothetical protein
MDGPLPPVGRPLQVLSVETTGEIREDLPKNAILRPFFGLQTAWAPQFHG